MSRSKRLPSESTSKDNTVDCSIVYCFYLIYKVSTMLYRVLVVRVYVLMKKDINKNVRGVRYAMLNDMAKTWPLSSRQFR